jgi:DNA methylase
MLPQANFESDIINVYCGDSLNFYTKWDTPTCIISDGPYGLGKFPGEPNTPEALPVWYAPHIAAWSNMAATNTTLWFWCSEVGWAMVHPVLELNGWQYEECCIWDKGIAHVAGNCNSKTIRGMPVVTEVAVRYTKKNLLRNSSGELISIKEWIRAEWLRSGLPMSKSNAACGVKNAATRKYLTQCHLWYFPPSDAMVNMANYCHRFGKPTFQPYFSIDGVTPLTEQTWDQMRAKWHHVHGVTNVWYEPAMHGKERIKTSEGYVHANQKPLSLITRQIQSCTDDGDVVWEPFGGTFSAMIAALRTGRKGYGCEINPDFYLFARSRLVNEIKNIKTEKRIAA